MYQEICRNDRTLRDYQQEAKKQIFESWEDCDNVMFQMPTGTGKTRLFTSIISDIKAWSIINQEDARVLIIAHRVELIEQISESLNRYKVSHGIIAGGHERNIQAQVQVASIQTITHRANIEVARSLPIRFIIIDEAHHSTANSYKKLWDLYPSAKKLGVTATPWRMNHQGFAKIYDKLILSRSIKEFIEQGWLSPYCFYSIGSGSKVTQEINSIDEFDIEGDYKISALEKTIDQSAIRAQLLDSYLKFAKGKKGIIYSISRKHSDHICAEYKAKGVNIVRIDRETPREERRLYVQKFRKGQIDIIVNVDIFSEGFDCPDIEFIQLARPTKSLVKYLQQVGRGLRPVNGKGKCIILDNVGSYLEFGLPDANRDWYSDFIGEQNEYPKTSVPSRVSKFNIKEKSFSEGNDVIGLIEDVDISGNQTQQIIGDWSSDDDILLRTLVEDRQCSLDVVASVFKRSVESIQKRCVDLSISYEATNG